MPLVLVGAVFVPLKRALDEVAWQVKTRGLIRQTLAEDAERIVASRVRVEGRELDVRLVVLGSAEDAEALRMRLIDALPTRSGVAPLVEVRAVPDADAFAGLQSRLLAPLPTPPPAPTTPPPTPEEQLETGRAHVRERVEALWLSATAGEPLFVDLSAEAPLWLRVVHLGERVAPETREVLERALERELAHELTLVTAHAPPELTLRANERFELVAALGATLPLAREIPDLRLCVTSPVPTRGRLGKEDEAFNASLERLLATHPRVERVGAGPWVVRFVQSSCDAP
jgi:hypothetical protein